MDAHPPPTRQFTGDTAQVTGAGAVTPMEVRKVQPGGHSKGGKTRSPQHINCKKKIAKKKGNRERESHGGGTCKLRDLADLSVACVHLSLKTILIKIM